MTCPRCPEGDLCDDCWVGEAPHRRAVGVRREDAAADLSVAIRAAVAAEREACAQVCEEIEWGFDARARKATYDHERDDAVRRAMAAARCAREIRARGKAAP